MADEIAPIPGWDRQKRYKDGEPHGWIQWKGTDVCIDLRCICGVLGHLDTDFMYNVKCKNCGRVYMVSGYVELVEWNKEELANPKNYHNTTTKVFKDNDD